MFTGSHFSTDADTTTSTSFEIFEGTSALTMATANRFAGSAHAAVAKRGVFSVALSGGTTPKNLYALMAANADLHARIPWPKIHFFFGDERHVAPDQSESNFRMVSEAMFQHLESAPHVHRICGELVDTKEAASRYQSDLQNFFDTPNRTEDGFPKFDLVFLGLGTDGHTASLFPNSPALQENHLWVVANWVAKLEAFRITLTVPAINSAREAIILVAGAPKAQIVSEVLKRAAIPPRYPVQRIMLSNGIKRWMLDSDAASILLKTDPRLLAAKAEQHCDQTRQPVAFCARL
jgi:6-phosphogluconolactonase